MTPMRLNALHAFEVALLDPCLAMTERGLRVDDARRRQMAADLAAARDPLHSELAAGVVRDVLAPRAPTFTPQEQRLFLERRVCKACRNGKKKRLTCTACGGAGRFERLTCNLNSDTQVKLILYDMLRLPKRTQGGKLRSDEEALKSLLPECAKRPEAHALIMGILRLSKLSTMQTIVERIAPGPDGRIRTVYNPAGTETGRLSSSESFLFPSTNLQNLPKREATDANFDVRACIVPDPGCVFVEADLAGAEAWVTAAAAGDHSLLATLRNGLDIHRWTAGHIFGKHATDVTGTERHLGKVARHALNYGMQWATFQRNVNVDADRTGVAISAAQARTICEGYHRLHPLLAAWWDRVLSRLTVDGTLTTCFGRRRRFYGRARGERLGETHREAIAYEPQSTIADLLNRGMLRWWKQHDGKVGRLLAQVHDSILVECPRERAPMVAQLVTQCLTEEIEVHGIRITVPVSVDVRESWAAREAA